MPVISRFFGIIIRMPVNDHAPPHFHAEHGSDRATIDIRSGRILEGRLPPSAVRRVREWTLLHRAELLTDWARARAGHPLLPIPPLE